MLVLLMYVLLFFLRWKKKQTNRENMLVTNKW
jgi:hypothetical protein